MLQDKILKPLNDGKIERAVIILHGLGDSAEGIMGLGEAFRTALPNTLFLAPNALFPCPYVPGGFQWFSGEDWTPATVLQGVKTAAPALNEYIDHVLESTGLTPDKIALVGFSQGTMMSLYVGPRRDTALAGILGYSGALIGGNELLSEKNSAPPVLLVHGTNDGIVPFASMAYAEQGLKNCAIQVQSVPCPNLDHSINEKGLHEGAFFLRSIFEI